MPFWNDVSFRRFLDEHPHLNGLRQYLPSDLKTKLFPQQIDIEKLWTSYKEHGYGYFFYALTRLLNPRSCVEIGVLQGFSLLTVASALEHNGLGQIEGFDLFEHYPYHNENMKNVIERIEGAGLQRWARVSRLDAFDAERNFDSVDYLHVDISNHGDIYRRMFGQWAGKVKKVMLFEGGSAQRDRVEWMIKFEKPSIVEALEEIRRNYPEWSISVLDPFPSLTVAVRRP